MKPIKVGLLGIGTVGGGTAAVLKRNAEEIRRRAGCEIQITRVATRTPSRATGVVDTHVQVDTDMSAVVNDPEIDVVVELIGGTTTAKELVLAEESSHKLTPTTSFRQKFSVFPSLRDSGKFRAVLDLGLTVAMSERVNLTAGLNHRYDSDPGTNLKKTDTMFVTGVSMRFD